eukprot:TRINITY_DN1044_c0_g2_i11.p1 TRINITY_DN1044_c0_g2~~TRINITY_DN1044_c0_g2_i11.p1  ORF type:complete len:383 (+),score=65.22 TRINITY_DN1044_c0_g2_i11:563-1711(+)
MTVEDYAEGYRKNVFTPTSVIKDICQGIKNLKARGMPIFVYVDEEDILRQARESEKRINSGKPLSLFDGVPIAVKDELDMKGYPTLSGTSTPYDDAPVATRDDITIQRLKETGAIIVGKTVMAEWGTTPLGFNPNIKGPSNPYNVNRYSGGSSSGCAVAVATGIVPVCLGMDGGGSIRIPASFCGVQGLSPTFGRVPINGGGLSYSVLHAGPLAVTSRDVALIYAILGRPQKGHFYHTLYNNIPSPLFTNFGQIQNINGLRLGIYWEYFNDCDPQVREVATQTVMFLKAKGAEIVNISIPHLAAFQMAHGLQISSEFFHDHEINYWSGIPHQAPPTVMQLSLGLSPSSQTFLAVNHLRSWGINFIKKLHEKVDVWIEKDNLS